MRTERHAHALEYLQLPWKPSWRQTIGEARHLMSLFSGSLSLPPSLHSYISSVCFSALPYMNIVSSQTHISSVWRILFKYFGSCTASPQPSSVGSFFSYPAETMRFPCPDATWCKLSERLRRTLPRSSVQHSEPFGWSNSGQAAVTSAPQHGNKAPALLMNLQGVKTTDDKNGTERAQL